MPEALTVSQISMSYISAAAKKTQRSGQQKGRRKIQAFHDISFSAECGEILGVIGSSGSGKTTLLRTIAGVFQPDTGTIDLHGHTVSLLALGNGFNNDLSGRDNIYLYGMLMGLSRKQIAEKVDRIIEFSDLGDAIDDQLKTYSSGMRSKLSFSASVELETDILLLDEVFAVGDMKFKKKSSARMKEIITDEAKTVILVSHSLGMVRSLCNRVLWIEKGEMMQIGDPEEVLNAYTAYSMKGQPGSSRGDPDAGAE